MVADSTFKTPDAGAEGTLPPPGPPEPQAMGRQRSGVRRMVSSLTRLASLQSQIILLQAKLVAQRVMTAAGLWAGAIAAGILAIVFLDIGVFEVLTDQELVGIRPAWAFLIFAAVHLLLAAGLIVGAKSILHKKLPGSETSQDE